MFFNHQQFPTKEQDNSVELLRVFCPQTYLIVQRVNTPTTTQVQIIVIEQCGKTNVFIHTGHVTKNSSLAEYVVWCWTYFERCASLLGLDVLGAEWRIRLSRSGSNLIHDETL